MMEKLAAQTDEPTIMPSGLIIPPQRLDGTQSGGAEISSPALANALAPPSSTPTNTQQSSSAPAAPPPKKATKSTKVNIKFIQW